MTRKIIGLATVLILCSSIPIALGQTAAPEATGNQSQPQGQTGPINTQSGGAPASSPQGETPPGMQSAPQGSRETVPTGRGGVPQGTPGQGAADPTASAPATVNAPPKIPSAQNDTAQFNPAVAAKDKQPTVAWTLALNDEKNRAMLQSIVTATPASGSNPAKIEGLTPAPGERVPASLALNPLPGPVANQMPNAQPYKFARVGNDILLVDPITRGVVAVLKN